MERDYRAFLDTDAMARWHPTYGCTAKVRAMDAYLGRRYRMSFTNFSTGHVQAFVGGSVELTLFAALRYAARVDDPQPRKEKG